MDEAPIEIPVSRWERFASDKRRLALLAVAVFVALFAVTAFVVRPLLDGGAGSVRPVPVGSLDPATAPPPGAVIGGEGSGDSGGSGSADDPDDPDDPEGTGDGAGGSASGGPGSAGGGTAAPDGGASGVIRAPYIAYRLDDAIRVARESGADAKTVAAGSVDAYALSPDATVLAVVDGGELALIGVSDGSRSVVGPAEPTALAWHPDSSALVFTRAVDGAHGVTDVVRVGRGGGAVTEVLRASAPVVTPDGTVVALPVSEDGGTVDPATGTLWVVAPGQTPRTLATKGPVAVCAAAAGKIAYAVSGLACLTTEGEMLCEPDIRMLAIDGHGDTRLVGPPSTDRPFGYGNLTFSPDGKKLLYAEVGDDGYSRAWIVGIDGDAPIPLTTRRDTYPMGWSADGSVVFFIEGNAFQGEATALMTAKADGTGRRVLIPGAGF